MDTDANVSVAALEAALSVTREERQHQPMHEPGPASLIHASLQPRAGAAGTRAATYCDLPDELIAQIGRYLDTRDLCHLSMVERRTHAVLHEQVLSKRHAHHAKTVVNAADVQALLIQIEHDIVEQPGLRIVPILTLLAQLLRNSFPKREQAAAFESVFTAAAGLPAAGYAVSRAVVTTLKYLDPSVRANAYEFCYAHVWQRHPILSRYGPALASQLHVLPRERFIQRYDEFVAWIPQLDTAERAALISALAVQLPAFVYGFNVRDAATLHQATQWYRTLQQALLSLPPSDQGKVMAALCVALPALGRQTSIAEYGQIRQIAMSLPQPAMAEAWLGLLRALPMFPAELQPAQLYSLYAMIERWPSQYSTFAAQTLLETVPALHVDTRAAAWHKAVMLLPPNASELVENVIQHALDQIAFLRADERSAARAAIARIIDAGDNADMALGQQD
ncbi:F-box protein [Mycetohabitans endofungorum]|uniref:F-box protein n=1 Tax=Mycetohabitans endofungorum TaxID=417203 RepID=UPI0030CCED68